MKYILVLMVVSSIVSNVAAQDRWQIQNNYTIRFDGRGAEGTFRGLTGTIVFDPNKLSASSFDVMLDPATIDTGNDTKDKHARGDSWFHVKKYPEIRFKSESVCRKTDGTGYVTKGKLTLHGTTLEAIIDFTFELSGTEEGIFNGRITIDREAYGIDGPWLSFTVGDDFEVVITVPVKGSEN